MKSVFLILFMLTGIIAFGQKKKTLAPSAHYTVIPFSETPPAIQAIFPAPAQNGILNTAEINEAGKLLEQCVAAYNLRQQPAYEKWSAMDSLITRDEFFINLSRYRLQYVPATIAGGQKVVYINAFCYAVGEKWRTEVVRVENGGNCFFNVMVSLTAHTFADIHVNAPE